MMSKLALGAVALTTLAGGTAGVATVDAFEQGKHKGGEAQQEVHTAIESNDFDAWYSAVTSREDSPLAGVATQDVFDRMVAIHDIAESGDKESAKEAREALRTELGLPDKPQKGERQKKMNKFLDEESREVVHAALEGNDFDTWVSVLTEAGAPEDRITEERFEKMMERFENRPDRGEKNGFQGRQ